MDIDRIINVVTIIIAVGAAILAWRKTKPEITAQQAKTIAEYQDMLDQEITKSKAERKESKVQIDGMALEIKIIKAELEKQTARADDYQRQIEVSKWEKAQLTQRISMLEKDLQRFEAYIRDLVGQLHDAKIEPVKMK
jgi:chromosome segregation ATPase